MFHVYQKVFFIYIVTSCPFARIRTCIFIFGKSASSCKDVSWLPKNLSFI